MFAPSFLQAVASTALLAIVSQAAQSNWGLGAAPAELASYGYTVGTKFLDDEVATYYVAEFVTYAGATPPEVAVVVLHKGGPNQKFVAVESAPATNGSDASVPGRRVAEAETERFNRVVFPALIRSRPALARAVRLHHFVYAKDKHFQATPSYREQQDRTKTNYEERLLSLVWLRDSADHAFAPHPKLAAGIPVEGFPVTIAEATRNRAPVVGSTRESLALPVAEKDRPYYEARSCSIRARLYKDDSLRRGWDDVARRRSAGTANRRTSELDELAIDLMPLAADEEARAAYEQCRIRLAAATAEAMADAAAAIRAKSEEKRRSINPRAPVKMTWYEYSGGLASTRDPAERKRLVDGMRAWNGYCLIAAETLLTMTTRNPAAFGIDARQSADAKLLQEIRANRDLQRAQFEKRFQPAERPLAQEVLEQQRTNYGAGLQERKSSESDVITYVKEQAFPCSDGLELQWNSRNVF